MPPRDQPLSKQTTTLLAFFPCKPLMGFPKHAGVVSFRDHHSPTCQPRKSAAPRFHHGCATAGWRCSQQRKLLLQLLWLLRMLPLCRTYPLLHRHCTMLNALAKRSGTEYRMQKVNVQACTTQPTRPLHHCAHRRVKFQLLAPPQRPRPHSARKYM